MRIWLDLANSPQVLFFRPIVPELEKRGHLVTITSRDFAQTTQLADRYKLRHTMVGGHGGKRLSKIGLRVIERAWQLIRFAKSRKFDLAVSHNSYAQALAATALRIPFVTSMDYEHQPANHLCFRLARKVIVPEYFPDWALLKYGARAEKTERYHGLKEQVYLKDFLAKSDFLASIGISRERIVVSMRPPGSWGLYHRFENPLFEQVLEYVAKNSEAYIVFLPRITSQAYAIRAKGYANVFIPQVAVDGPNLLFHSDLVISGGGTINREAAVLGTPTYSVFKGKLAAVDHYLINHGRMKHVANELDISKIKVTKKQKCEILSADGLVQEIVDAILSAYTKK